LTDAIDGEHALSAREIKRRTPWRASVLIAQASDALASALAESGRPVVLSSDANVANVLAALLGLEESAGCQPHDKSHLLVEELDGTKLDEALCERLQKQLARAGSPVAGVGIARASGARPGRLVIAEEHDEPLLTVEACVRASTSWTRSSILLLDSRERAVSLARKHAKKRVDTAAQFLARLILLERRGPATAKANDALLAALVEGE
jgi:hypothetical protein